MAGRNESKKTFTNFDSETTGKTQKITSTRDSGEKISGEVEKAPKSRIKVDICKRKIKLDPEGIEFEVGDWSKKAICYYCKKQYAKLGRHLLTAHPETAEAKQLKLLDVKKGDPRKKGP